MMYAAIESMYRHGRITAAGVQAAVTRGWITLEQAQEILGALDEETISNLPAKLDGDSPVQILVGPENIAQELKDTSVVMTRFDIGDGMQGMIGVVGPQRMDYAQITARLSYFAEGLGRMFGKPELPEGKKEE